MSPAGAAAGLCGDCRHARRIQSARGSQFLLCERAATDPRFRRYPALPVLRCLGYEAGANQQLPPLKKGD